MTNVCVALPLYEESLRKAAKCGGMLKPDSVISRCLWCVKGVEDAMAIDAGGAGERYRQGVPALDLYIERGTERVPNDRRYHVVHQGDLVGSFRNLRAAQLCYKRKQDALGFVVTPEPIATDELLRREDLERDLLRTASFWAESHRFAAG